MLVNDREKYEAFWKEFPMERHHIPGRPRDALLRHRSVRCLLFFVIPIKMKWMALIDVALILVAVIQNLMYGSWVGALLPLASFVNYFSAGRLLPLDDHLMDAGSAVAGCGPASVDLFMEAMADGGVTCGLSRPMAMECAAQTLIGAAKLMLATGTHPGALKDAVCSPSGATIQGVRTLEKAGFRGAVIDAVIAAYEKAAVR